MLLASSAYDDQEIVKLKAELVAIRAQYDSLLEASLQQIAGRSNETPKTGNKGNNSPTTSSSTNLHKHFTNSSPATTSSSSLSKLDGDSPREKEKDKDKEKDRDETDSKGGKKNMKRFINKFIINKKQERESKEASLENILPSGFTLSSPSTSYQDLPRLQVNTLASRKHVLLSGPAPRVQGEPEDEIGLSSHDDVAAGRSISTYPMLPGSSVRLGDPIADCFKAHVFENRVIACITDGCAWGANARDAAQKANNGFVEYVDEHNNGITDVKQAGEVLLHALEHAHNSIIEGKPGAGQTTIIGGVLLEITKGDSFTPQWEFICANVGDCKAFCFSQGEITDITKGNRKNTSDVRDSGGFLGPDAAGKPDLQNLNLFCQPCIDGDLIILMTDGVHDNLDPQLLGKLPSDMSKEFNLIGEKWEDVDPIKATNAKNVYSTDLLKMLILKGSDEDHPPTPTEVTNRLVDYCISVTQKSRDWFAKNQDKRMPDNHLELPGKMDHTTCLCFKVGRYTGLPDSPGLPRQWQTVTSPYVARVQL